MQLVLPANDRRLYGVSVTGERRRATGDIGEESVAATDDGLDHGLTEHAPEVANMSAQDTVAHRNLSPHRIDELLLGDESPGVLDEVAQDSKRLAPERELLAGLPQTLVGNVQLEWRECEQRQPPAESLSPSSPRQESAPCPTDIGGSCPPPRYKTS